MIQIYAPGNTNFDRNGDVALQPSLCDLDMTLNGEWELEIEAPADELGKFRAVTTGAVVAVPTPWSDKQLFRIYDHDTSDEGSVGLARPIFLDAENEVMILDKRPTNCIGQEALDAILSGTKYKGKSNITKTATAYYIRKNAIQAIASNEENSFINRWGGEIAYDNFTVTVNERMGRDRGLRVEFGRNIKSIHDHGNSEELATRIYPVAYNGRMISGDKQYVDSERIGDYPIVYSKILECQDIKLREDLIGEPSDGDIVCDTQAALDAALRQRCAEEYAAGADVLETAYDVDMDDLSTKEEYAEYKNLEKVELGDTVHCRHRRLKISADARTVRLVWNCILRKNKKLYIGDYKQDYFARLNDTAQRLQDLRDEMVESEGRVNQAVREASERLDKALKEAAGLYCTEKDDGKGGTIILLHDKKTLEESTNVIMLTADAIGFSTDGGHSYPYGFTIDGEFVARLLSAHGINADWIRTGILQSYPDEEGNVAFFLDLVKGILKMNATELTVAGQSVNQALSNAVTGVQQQFYLSTSSENPTGGKWSDTQPPWEQGKFIWSRQYVTYGDGNHAYLPSEKGVCITGNTGEAGTDGTNGIGVESVEAEYCVTKSESSAAGGNWSTTMPTVKDGEYIWSRQKVTYSDGSIGYTEAYCMTKTMGDIAQQKVEAQTQTDIFNKLTNNGALEGLFMLDGNLYINASYLVSGILQSLDGETFFLDLVNGILRMNATELTIAGQNVNEALGDAITGAVQQFYLSDSPTALAGGEWSNTQPEWTPGKYIWSRQYVIYGDGTSEYTPSEDGVCITGNTGADGEDGTNGTSSYTHIRYSVNADGAGFVAEPTASTKYIGIYTGTSQTAPANKESYTWSKYMGDNGADGKDGNGIRSISYFYAATPNQTPPAASDITGTTIITYYYAVTTTQTPPAASAVTSTTIPALSATNKYLWQKEVIDFTDASVADKTTVILLAVYGDKGKDGTNGTNGTSVTITATSITYQASDSGTTTPTGSWSASVPPVENGQYLWTKTVVTYSDNTSTTAYSVAYKGTNGADGASARVVITTNGGTTEKIEDWSTPGRKIGFNPADSAVMDTLKVGDQALFRLRNNETGIYLYIIGTIYRLDRAGEPNITNDMIWCEAAGKITSGVDGTNGVGIESVTAEYILSPSATSPDEDPMAQWSADIPEALPGRYIWTRQKIVYSTGAVEYAGLYCMTKTMGDIAKQKVDEQTQEDIFNKLTNNGALQGVFMRDGVLYINAQYLRGDTIDLNLLRLVGTLCGLMQGYGATSSGQTTRGIVLYGNGVDASGNANPPYIIVTNAGVRAQITKDYSFNMGGNTFESYGNIYARKSGEANGGIWADGDAEIAGRVYVGSQCATVYENDIGQNLMTFANNNLRSWLAGWQVYVGEDVNGYETHLRGGSIYSSKGIQVNSDRRMKKDIEPLDDAYALAFDKITPVRYRYKTDPDAGPYRLGYIAQDVREALEAAGVSDTGIVGEWKDKDGNTHLTLAHDELIAVQHMKINSLEAELKQIKEDLKKWIATS